MTRRFSPPTTLSLRAVPLPPSRAGAWIRSGHVVCCFLMSFSGVSCLFVLYGVVRICVVLLCLCYVVLYYVYHIMLYIYIFFFLSVILCYFFLFVCLFVVSPSQFLLLLSFISCYNFPLFVLSPSYYVVDVVVVSGFCTLYFLLKNDCPRTIFFYQDSAKLCYFLVCYISNYICFNYYFSRLFFMSFMMLQSVFTPTRCALYKMNYIYLSF